MRNFQIIDRWSTRLSIRLYSFIQDIINFWRKKRAIGWSYKTIIIVMSTGKNSGKNEYLEGIEHLAELQILQ